MTVSERTLSSPELVEGRIEAVVEERLCKHRPSTTPMLGFDTLLRSYSTTSIASAQELRVRK